MEFAVGTAITLPNSENEEKTTELTTWWIHFVDILVHLPYLECGSRQKLVEFLKDYYAGNRIELQNIEQFENDYQTSQAIWWYTRDTFLYRLLNKALRQHNIELIVYFGFFVQDLYRQISLEHEKQFIRASLSSYPIIKAYRGQIMLRSEVEDIHEAAGSLVVNSYFSTTLDRNLAMIYLNPNYEPWDPFQAVLFQIEIDNSIQYMRTRPYANISHISQFPTESEILFLIGTQFHIIDSTYNYEEKIWIARLKLMRDENLKNENYFKRKTLKNCIVELNGSSFRCDLEKQYTIFHTLEQLYPKEKWLFEAVKLCARAEYQYWHGKRDYEVVCAIYEHAVKVFQDNAIRNRELNLFINIARIYLRISWYYSARGEKNSVECRKYAHLALEYYILALEDAEIDKEDYDLIEIYGELSNIFKTKMKESKNIEDGFIAIKYGELCLQSLIKNYSAHDFEVGNYLDQLAELNQSLHNYDDAIDYYDRALNIYLPLETHINSLFIYHTATKLVDIYIQYKHDYESAIRYELVLHESNLRCNASSENDTEAKTREKKRSIADSYDNLCEIYTKVGKYKLAKENLKIAIRLYKENNDADKDGRYGFLQRKLKAIKKMKKQPSNGGIILTDQDILMKKLKQELELESNDDDYDF